MAEPPNVPFLVSLGSFPSEIFRGFWVEVLGLRKNNRQPPGEQAPVSIRDASREEGGFAGDGIPGLLCLCALQLLGWLLVFLGGLRVRLPSSSLPPPLPPSVSPVRPRRVARSGREN